MPKAKAHPSQLGLDFGPPPLVTTAGSLAGLERGICEMVGVMLNTDDRPREVIAAQMSILADEEISRAMLDAYSSPAREGHKVPMSRALVLAAVTARQDLLNPVMRQIGASVLVGDEVLTARLGQIDRQMEKLKAERRLLAGAAPLIRENKVG